jgi:hypothetical protein
MAERSTTEGLDWLLNLICSQTLYLFLFTSQTATTVPAASAVLATNTGVTEASYSGYARVTLTPSDWGAATALSGGTGRQRTNILKAFAQLAAGASITTFNGYGISDNATPGAGVALGYSNFAEGAMQNLGEGDTPRVTPTIGIGE